MRSTAPTDLPVAQAIPALLDALGGRQGHAPNAVLVAPPGAGKTTGVPGALLDAPWRQGRRILLVLPRRLAARAAAARIAERLGLVHGREVGHVARLDTLTSPDAAIECVTPGVFLNRLLAAPDLPDVAALLFDEVHERNFETDLGLALALDAQASFRDDLRLVAMSATIDGARLADRMGAPLVESPGRQFPVTIRYRPVPAGAGLEAAGRRGVAEALAEGEGDVLMFLPGVAEIERVAKALDLPPDVRLVRLHGSLPPAEQRAALAPGTGRRLVLATAIAETSLTVPGVRTVVDLGLARRPRFDRGSGLTHLETVKASQASLAQRAGRAGRLGPGLVIRLFAEGELRGRPPFDPPEILEADLAPLCLALARWGTTDPRRLAFPDPPPPAALAEARARLVAMGALEPSGALTPLGARLATMPLPPALGALLVAGARSGEAGLAARMAVILSERGQGGQSVDLEERLAQLARAGGAGDALARRFAALVADVPAEQTPRGPALLLAAAMPGRIARRRGAADPKARDVPYLMASGRGVRLDATLPLAREEWLVVADAGGAGPDSRVRLAVALDRAGAAALAERAECTIDVRLDGRRVVAETVRRLGALTLARTPLDDAALARQLPAVRAALAGALAREGLGLLALNAEAQGRLARLRFAAAAGVPGLPDLSDTALAEALVADAGPVRHLDALDLAGLLDRIEAGADRQGLDRLAPASLETPAGSRHAIDYASAGGPAVEVRVQALFGLAVHPQVAGGTPLVLHLLSPAGRPVAVTRDLPGFWRSGWREVVRDMRGRYPKHPWPDDPLAAAPTLRTKAGAGRT